MKGSSILPNDFPKKRESSTCYRGDRPLVMIKDAVYLFPVTESDKKVDRQMYELSHSLNQISTLMMFLNFNNLIQV